jgi:membrane protein implicated in regulation of membrane protease activity
MVGSQPAAARTVTSKVKIMDWSWEAWLIIAIVLVLFELLSMDFVFLMLAGGAAIATAAAALNFSAVLVWLLAIGGAATGLWIVRPKIAERIHRGPELKIGAAALVGLRAMVLEDVVPNHPGRVKIRGDEWTALPSDDVSTWAAGVHVQVVEIKGAIAYVSADNEN